MTPEQLTQIRFSLVLKAIERGLPTDHGFTDLKEMYAWVIGPPSTIIPAKQVEIIK